MLLEISGEITQERMKGWSQSKNNTQVWMWLVIEARSNAVKILHIFSMQYCIGTWNVKSMNQGKLEVVKQEMARVLWTVLWDLQDLSEQTPKKDVLFIIGDWNAKVGSQETLGVTSKFGLGVWNEAGQRLIEFCQENALVIANTLFQQHKRRLYTWTSSDGQHQNQIGYILCSQRWRSSVQSAKTRLGADCGSDQNSVDKLPLIRN